MSDRKTDAEIDSLLDMGMRRHMEGDLAAAADSYENVLAARPDNADALNLLGVVALQCGAPDQAADLLRQAVELDDRHPGYQNNLGQALDALGDVAAALRHYRAALALAPGDPRCLNNIGLALSQLGDLKGAIEAASAAVEGDPENAEYHHNLGAILFDMGRTDEAERAFQQALKLNPGQAGTYASMGLILAERGDRQQAVDYCLQATRLDPFYKEGHEACRKLLWDLGDSGNMNISYRLACERHPDSAAAFLNYGTALLESHLPGEAVEVLDRALALDGRNAAALSKKGAALARMGRWQEAIAVQQEAIAIDDSDFSFFEALGDAYSAERNFEAAARAYWDAHARNPRRSSVLASLTIALNEIGDPAVERLVDYDTFVTSRFIDLPEGFASLEAFNDALHAELAAQHVRRPFPIGQTMRGGTQNKGHLFRGAEGLVGVVQQHISDALSTYIAGLDRDPDHPFLRFVNPDFRFTGAWSTILLESGYDESHIHNDGWISGVYYVKAPAIDDESWAKGEGCIQFGRPPRAYASPRNDVRRRIRPEPGMAVFFPSYYWHGVEPFHQKGLRHSIAFDVL
jgi:tetratricopeptide (TPR) repeat protein